MIFSCTKYLHTTMIGFIALLLVSCGSGSNPVSNTESDEFKEARANISHIFNTSEINIISGVSTSPAKGVHPYIEVEIANSPRIDHDSMSMEQGFSWLAMIAYDAVKQKENKPELTFDVVIERKVKGKPVRYSSSYTYPTVKKMFGHYTLADSACKLLLAEKYEQAYGLFGNEFKEKVSFSSFRVLFETSTEDFGPMRDYRFKGVRLKTMSVYGKEHNTAIVDAYAKRKENYNMRFVFDMDAERYEILGMDL
jgi:hypothetical protein